MGFMIIKANKYIKVELDGQCHRIEAGEEARNLLRQNR